MSAEIIRLADRRRPAAVPRMPGAGAMGAFAAACRALTLSLDRLCQQAAAIRAELDGLAHA